MVKEQAQVISKISKIMDIFKHSNAEIRPHFFLTGPSGTGKSFIIKKMAEHNKFNYFEVNAAQLTKEGTSGNSLSKALAPLMSAEGRPTICFVDEIDKLFISNNNNDSHAHEATIGVQNEFLKILESETTSLYGKYATYVDTKVDNVLFIFAGAFNGEEDLTIDRLREFGIKTEFLGRVGLLYSIETLSLDSMIALLDVSELLSKYLALFPNVPAMQVKTAVIGALRNKHAQNTLGVRLLNTLINQYFVNGGLLDAAEVTASSFSEPMTLG